jgi:hypothetical protein
LDAAEEPVGDATGGGTGASDAGGNADGAADAGSDASAADASGEGSTVDGAVVDGGGDGQVPTLVCNHQVCASAEFCATGLDDAGDGEAGDGEAGSSSLECKAAVFGNVCDNPTATLFFDRSEWDVSHAPDNDAVTAIGAALASACHMTIESPDAGPINPDAGEPSIEPTTGIGNLCVTGGGANVQPTVGYLDNRSLTDVYLRGANDDAGVFDLYFTDRSHPGAPVDVAAAPFSSTPTNTDYFLVQLAVDPASGSLCLDVIGMSGQGTAAGGYYVANEFLANNAYVSSTKSWYVYYWVAASDAGAGVPSSSDTFTLVASGP